MATGRVPINGTAAIQSTIVDAKGDLIAATGSDVVARLAVGTNGTVLTADSAETTGLKWVAPAGGGKVLQVIQATNNSTPTSTTNTFADTNLSATITPAATGSRILVQVVHPEILLSASLYASGNFRIMRDSTAIYTVNNALYAELSSNRVHSFSMFYVDSPNTTSAVTYKTQFANANAGSNVQLNSQSGSGSVIILTEIGA